ncbi:MAG TPA: hypothetical protein VF929_07020, partial [Gemmatimonadaceae bacterium]
PGTIAQLAAHLVDELRALLAHCRTARPTATPSDFPLTQLTQAELDVIEARRRAPRDAPRRATT